MRTLTWLGRLVALLSIAVVPWAPLRADDLTGSSLFLCSALQATFCIQDEECEVGPPSAWNIPQFVEIDVAAKTLSTTKASGTSRTTPIKLVERSEGLIFLQGTEAGRAFSFVITEKTGMAAVAVARDGVTVGVFAACTPRAGR